MNSKMLKYITSAPASGDTTYHAANILTNISHSDMLELNMVAAICEISPKGVCTSGLS